MMMLPPELRFPMPERFSGNKTKFCAFCNACQLYVALQPHTFLLETTKVGFIISLLQRESQTWAHCLLEKEDDKLGLILLSIQIDRQLRECRLEKPTGQVHPV